MWFFILVNSPFNESADHGLIVGLSESPIDRPQTKQPDWICDEQNIRTTFIPVDIYQYSTISDLSGCGDMEHNKLSSLFVLKTHKAVQDN